MDMFFLGMHDLDRTLRLDRLFISANRLWERRFAPMGCEWVMDSGAFTEILAHGRYLHSTEDYAHLIRTFSRDRGLLAVVSQDFMCERLICARVLGLDVSKLTPQTAERTLRTLLPARAWVRQIRIHQQLTIERYDALRAMDLGGTYLMPVLQGFTPAQYARHVRAYGDRLLQGAWVGVGSVCKRQGDPEAVVAVLKAILAVRPDLKLHGFGLKLTALADPRVTALLHSADSMAWSYAARKRKGDPNSVWVARAFEAEVLAAAGIEPGEWLSVYLRDGRVFRYAAEANEKAGARRASLQRHKEINARIEAEWRASGVLVGGTAA